MRKNEFLLLSDREEQVLLMSTKGLTDKEIARKLGLSIATVNTYWVRIRTKLGGANRAELVAAALHKNAEETLTAKESENQRLIGEVIRRAEAERALRESQDRLQAIIDEAPVVIFIKDLQGRYTLINNAFADLLGKDKRELIGKRDNDFFGHDAAEAFRGQDQKVLTGHESLETDDEIQTPNGPRKFSTIKFPLFNSEGAAYGICGIAREMTTRLEIEQTLKASEERYRTLIERSTDVITLLDRDGTILYVSPAAAQMFGYEPSHMEGQNAFHYIARDDLIPIKRDFDRLLEDPKATVRAEYRVKDARGGLRFVEGQAQNLLDNPSIQAVLLNYRDVTARKVSERRLSAQLAISEALSQTDGISATMRRIVQDLCGILSFVCGGVWLLEQTGKTLEYCTGWYSNRKGLREFESASEKATFKTGELFPGAIMQEEKPYWDVEIDLRRYLRSEALQKAGLKVAIGFPIVGPKGFLGAVELFSHQSTEPDQEFLQVLDLIGHQMGQYLQRYRAEGSERVLGERLEGVNQELKVANEALERRVRTRTIELEEANERLREEVAQRKRAEEDLLMSFRFARNVLDCSVDGIVGFDTRLRTTVWNESMEEMSGIPSDDALGQCILDLFPFLNDSDEEHYYQRVLSGETVLTPPKAFWVSQTRRGGHFEGKFSPVRDMEESIIGGLGVIRQLPQFG